MRLHNNKRGRCFILRKRRRNILLLKEVVAKGIDVGEEHLGLSDVELEVGLGLEVGLEPSRDEVKVSV